MRPVVARPGRIIALTLAGALLVGSAGTTAAAQEVSAADVAAAEAEAAAAADRLAEARRRLADAAETRDRMASTLDTLREREAEADVEAAAEALAVRDRLTRMYMVAGRSEEALSVVGELGPFFTRIAYLGAIAERDREVVNRFTVLLDELVNLQGDAELRLEDLASKVAALELVMASRTAALDEATVRVTETRERFAAQERARQAALAAEIARQEAALAAQGGGQGSSGASSSNAPTTTTTIPVVTGHSYDPSGGVEQWRPLLTSIFARWGLTQEKCGPNGCLGPHVDDALTIMWCESRGVPFAVNPSSGTTGLFQHRPVYWPDRVARTRGYAAGSGLPPDATPYDPAHNIEVAALLIHESRETLIGNRSLGGPWDDGPQPFGHWDSTSRYCADPPLVSP